MSHSDEPLTFSSLFAGFIGFIMLYTSILMALMLFVRVRYLLSLTPSLPIYHLVQFDVYSSLLLFFFHFCFGAGIFEVFSLFSEEL